MASGESVWSGCETADGKAHSGMAKSAAVRILAFRCHHRIIDRHCIPWGSPLQSLALFCSCFLHHCRVRIASPATLQLGCLLALLVCTSYLVSYALHTPVTQSNSFRSRSSLPELSCSQLTLTCIRYLLLPCLAGLAISILTTWMLLSAMHLIMTLNRLQYPSLAFSSRRLSLAFAVWGPHWRCVHLPPISTPHAQSSI